MKLKIRMNLLGIYDLILALGAVFIGVMMVSSSSEIFSDYPKEWLSKVPFESWFIPGIIAILIFGLGKIIEAIPSFRKNKNSWVISAIMGGIFFISIVAQVITLGEWYMVTVEFFIFSIIELWLSRYEFSSYKKTV